MKINVFTIRNKTTKELIYAEGTSQDDEYVSFFRLEEKWFTDNDKATMDDLGAWYKYPDGYGFDEEVRHLENYEYDLITFALEEMEIK